MIFMTPNLDWLLLTKRPENIVPCLLDSTKGVVVDHGDFTDRVFAWAQGEREPHNVWIGTSVENQATADQRIPHLLKVPAVVRFLSCEPLLGPVDLGLRHGCAGCNHPGNLMPAMNEHGRCSRCDGTGHEPSGIGWAIMGGESGHGARPCNIDWIRSIRDQCKAAGVPCFIKQLGAKPYDSAHKDIWCNGEHHYTRPNGHKDLIEAATAPGYSITDHQLPRLLQDSKGGDWNEWAEDLRVREFPEASE